VRPQRLGTRITLEFPIPVAPEPVVFEELSGSPKFPGNPRDHSPCSQTPARPDPRKGPIVNGSDVVPALAGQRRLSTTRISGLHHTAFGLAVYASQRRLPATTQDSLPVAGPSSTGRDSNPQGSYRKVSNLVIHPPFPSFLAQPGFLIKPFRPSPVAMSWKAPILQGKVAQQNWRERSGSSRPTFHQPRVGVD
jgi:hypothetical protein